MQALSVVIITYNEAANIARCIRSVRSIADEIVLLDSYSTDGTAEIAADLGAHVYQEKFRGYIDQKNLAIRLASHPFILSLDADEELDRTLIDSIREVKKDFTHRAYSMNRCTNFCGRFIRHGLWYPDRKIRLFDRTIASWGGMNPHDKIILKNNVKSFHLKGDILHYSFETVDDLIWQNNRLSSIAASSLFAKGKTSSWIKMLVHPAWAFLNGYLFRGGFLHGLDGFSIAIHTSHQVYLKYSKLYRLQNQKVKKQSALIQGQSVIPPAESRVGNNP
jgi:glycosyltransferase involved in cell wall biosynthesis